tara:strand:- start:971 stop:1327 length:357 start_codon:yes stop_codon:yes gene_type:complete
MKLTWKAFLKLHLIAWKENGKKSGLSFEAHQTQHRESLIKQGFEIPKSGQSSNRAKDYLEHINSMSNPRSDIKEFKAELENMLYSYEILTNNYKETLISLGKEFGYSYGKLSLNWAKK